MQLVPDTLSMFDAIARRYELVNALISIGSHSNWNKKLVENIIAEKKPKKVLDLCSGTGAITSRLIYELTKQKIPIPSIDCVDFSPQILSIARENLKTTGPSVQFIQASAEDLPISSHTYDTICLAYGIRNILDKKKALEEAFRVLQAQGTLHILELSKPQNRCIRVLHSLYLRTLVPLIGGLITRKFDAYQYLRHSIANFSVPHLLTQLQDVGFQNLQLRTYSLGTITYIRAQKS
jgi:demethylmenaquinone methyltransferase/2-methoxy-6-polyprenyl-1,4-benzoquinol methylase